MKKFLIILILAANLFVAVCGVFTHPERIGRSYHSHRIDQEVFWEDRIGLFFLIVPGLLALGTDWGLGTLYK